MSARFICNHDHTVKQRFIFPSGTNAEFVRGVMDIEKDEDAAFLRKNKLFGQVIFESDPTIPAHTENPHEEFVNPETAAIAELLAQTSYCDLCDATFTSEANYKRHVAMKHPELRGEEVDNG